MELKKKDSSQPNDLSIYKLIRYCWRPATTFVNINFCSPLIQIYAFRLYQPRDRTPDKKQEN